MTKTDVYTAQAFCRNCGYEGPIEAPVGQKVYEQPCPLCANNFLSPVAQREWDQHNPRNPWQSFW